MGVPAHLTETLATSHGFCGWQGWSASRVSGNQSLNLWTSVDIGGLSAKVSAKWPKRGRWKKRKPATHSSGGHFYAGVPTGIRTPVLTVKG